MPLTPESALAKDKRTGLASMQHRHFATIAEIIRYERSAGLREHMAQHFARFLAETNPQFSRDRFLAACDVEC